MPALLLLLASSTLKATVILILAALVARLMRHRTAASRHLVWTAALGSATAVFGLSIILPAWRVIQVPATFVAADAARLTLNTPSVQHRATSSSAWYSSPGGALSGAPVAPAAPSNAPDWPAWILALWAIGAATVACRDITGRITLYRLGRASSRHAECEAIVRQLACEMGIRRRIRVSCGDDVELPMTWGIFHPRIMLPSDVADWSPACRLHVLQHELAHVSRGDAATQLVAQVATALFWFHPLVWLGAARMRSERERACDDRVLACGVVASDYAADLLTFVAHHGFVEPQATTLGFAERSKFEQRLKALLDPSIARGPLSPSHLALVLGFSAILVVPLAAMQRAAMGTPRPVAVRSEAGVIQPLPMAAPARAVRLASRATVASKQPGAAPADRSDAFAGCAVRMTSEHSDGRMDGDSDSRWTASGGNDGCRYTLASAGTVLLNSDATAIDQISAGGYLDLSTNIHGDLTRLVARASAAGDVSYDFSHNGQSVDFPVAGDAWLQRFLLCVDRTTAFAIDRRFPLLLSAGGPGNVLAEVERMHSDYAMSVYLTRLIRTTSLDSSSIGWIGQLVSRMSAQHMAGEVIIAVATRQHLPEDARAGFARMAESIRESNQRSRALAALAQGR
jgi:beta-lactamase regulating signal transducer with metallopeptidase domain